MSRISFLLSVVAVGLLAPVGECRAQVNGARQTWINSGGSFSVAPVVTNGGRYARMGMSVGVSELVDVYTFSPVRGYSGLTPVNPIGFGFGGAGLNQGPRRLGTNNSPPIRKPKSSVFVAAAWRFDKDKDARLNKDELEKLASAVVAELKRTPAAYEKLKRGARGANKVAKQITEKDVAEAFLKQCLTYDRDKDGKLKPSETDVMAAALMRFLG